MSSQNSPLEEALAATWKHPQALREASEEVTVALELAWAAARTVFGKQAKPQHAIDLARLFIAEARERPPAPTLAEPLGAEEARPSGAHQGEPRAGKDSRHLQAPREPEVDVNAPAPPRTRRTAVSDDPPKAPSKAGRPARM
ncbi:MAG: hypothetical protein EOP38_07400 [Rubrivivax sp.]|nr:MAG: hypothetical protein EOP38_07400 [Rubrivivax sp.]